MKLTLEDESEGTASRGYISVEIIDDDGDLILDLDVAPEWVPDVDEFAELFDVVTEIDEDDEPPGPGGPVL